MRLWVTVAVAFAAAVGAAACDSGGDGGSSSDTTAAGGAGAQSTLPLPATNPPDSTLQIRAVLGEAADCPPQTKNPPADQPAAMFRTNQCMSLAPSGLTVSKASVVAVARAAGPAVLLTLQGDDVKTFAELSRDYVGKTLALVAFGKVLALPLLGQPVTDGRLEITGLSQNEAADLKAILA